MKHIVAALAMIFVVSGSSAFAQQAGSAPRPLSPEAQQAITMRDLQAFIQDIRGPTEYALSEAQATIAAQQLKLSWWAKYAAGLKKVK